MIDNATLYRRVLNRSMSSLPNESYLLERARGGDQAAFTQLWEAHRTTVYRKVYAMVRNADEAEDITQEAFIKAWNSLPGFRGGSMFRTWVTRIAINHTLDHIKRHKNRQTDEIPETYASRQPDDDPEACAVRNDMARLVHRAVDSLPEHHATVIRMRDFADMEYSDMAAVLGTTVGGVKLRLFRARQHLKARLQSLMGEA